MNNTLIPNTNITVKELKKLLCEHFNASPTIIKNYKNNKITLIPRRVYRGATTTFDNLASFCKKYKITYKIGYYQWFKGVAIELN